MTKAIGALMVAACPAALAAVALDVLTPAEGITIGFVSAILGFIVIITDS